MDMEARVQPEYAFNGGSADREMCWTSSPTDSTAISDVRAVILEAERAKNEGRTGDAASLLLPHFVELGVYGRALLFEVLLMEGALDDLLHLFGQELSPEEVPRVISALIEARRLVDAQSLLDRYQGVLVLDANNFFRQRLRILQSEGTHGC
jgi:hypothetical protein